MCQAILNQIFIVFLGRAWWLNKTWVYLLMFNFDFTTLSSICDFSIIISDIASHFIHKLQNTTPLYINILENTHPSILLIRTILQRRTKNMNFVFIVADEIDEEQTEAEQNSCENFGK